MSKTPTKEIGRSRDNPDGLNHIGALTANHGNDGEAVCCIAVGAGT